jgi:hypothetical protein
MGQLYKAPESGKSVEYTFVGNDLIPAYPTIGTFYNLSIVVSLAVNDAFVFQPEALRPELNFILPKSLSTTRISKDSIQSVKSDRRTSYGGDSSVNQIYF